MARHYDVLTFDCYGTLIDWESGITRAFQEAARRDGVRLERDAILAAHADIEPTIQAEGFRSYREVLEELAVRSAERLGWRLTPKRARFLPDSLAGWTPFPDTNPALERLRDRGYRLGILSNIDDALLAGTLKHFTVPFDILVTAEQVRAYKPAAPHFRRARELVGARRWLHAAQSYFHDVEPAVDQRVAVAWVNRHGDEPTGEARPTAEVRDLHGLVEWLEGEEGRK